VARKELAKDERYRRVLIAAYMRLVENGVYINLPLLDAMRDCIDNNESGMSEWAVSKAGKVRWVV
jgi:hypothetical protein